MALDILDPKDDYIFKRIFGQDEVIFIDFVNSIFKDKNLPTVRSVTFINSEIPKDIEDGKTARLDVRAILDDGSHINIEIQVDSQKHFIKRSTLYWSRMYSEQLKEGQKYHQLTRCVCINVLAFNLFPDQKYHHVVGGLEIDTHEWIIPEFEIHFIELKKLPGKVYTQMTHLEKWITFLQTPEEYVLEKLSLNEPIISKAKDTLYYVSQDRVDRQIYNARLKFQLDYNSKVYDSLEEGIIKGKAEGLAKGLAKGNAEGLVKGKAEGLAKGKAEGLAKGKAEGIQEGKIAVAKNLKSKGVSLEVISESTGLSIKEIKKI